MSSKGRRVKETRGQYERCAAKPCKRKATRDGLCAMHHSIASYQPLTLKPGREVSRG